MLLVNKLLIAIIQLYLNKGMIERTEQNKKQNKDQMQKQQSIVFTETLTNENKQDH